MELFGSTFRQTRDALTGKPAKGGEADPRITAIGRIVVSVVLAVVGTYLMFLDQGKTQAMGSSILGAVVGYWLR